MEENNFSGFGEEEITEFTPTEFSSAGASASGSSAPEEIPFGSMTEEPVTGNDYVSMNLKESSEDAGEEKAPEEKKISGKTIFKEIMSWVRTIAIGVLVGVFLVVFVIQRDNVYGDSMNPTLQDGDVVFTQKIATYFDSYKRGDIVILDGHDMPGYDREEYLIKRIIGLPGETVRIADGNVYIKPVGSDEFYLLDEPYIADDVDTLMMNVGIEHGYDEITLGEDEYYCIGDNRPVSKDSRILGPFTADRIKGIAVICVAPFDHFGLIGGDNKQ